MVTENILTQLLAFRFAYWQWTAICIVSKHATLC